MLQSTPTVRVYRHGHLFAGIGAGARGFNQAQPRVGNMVGRWECAAESTSTLARSAISSG